MTLLKKVKHVLDAIDCVFPFWGAFLLVFIMLAITTDVLTRFFLNKPIIWVTEITEYCLLYIPFLGGAWVLKREGHVKIDILLNRLKPFPQSLLNIMSSILGTIICGVVFWYSIKVTLDSYQGGYFSPTILQIPKWPVHAVIPLGSFLLFIQFIRSTCQYIGKATHHPKKP